MKGFQTEKMKNVREYKRVTFEIEILAKKVSTAFLWKIRERTDDVYDVFPFIYDLN